MATAIASLVGGAAGAGPGSASRHARPRTLVVWFDGVTLDQCAKNDAATDCADDPTGFAWGLPGSAGQPTGSAEYPTGSAGGLTGFTGVLTGLDDQATGGAGAAPLGSSRAVATAEPSPRRSVPAAAAVAAPTS